jgi:hypothetical protein
MTILAAKGRNIYQHSSFDQKTKNMMMMGRLFANRYEFWRQVMRTNQDRKERAREMKGEKGGKETGQRLTVLIHVPRSF